MIKEDFKHLAVKHRLTTESGYYQFWRTGGRKSFPFCVKRNGNLRGIQRGKGEIFQ